MTIAVEVPFELHRYIIGQKGSGIRKMMDEFEVGVFTADFSGVFIHFAAVLCCVFNIFIAFYRFFFFSSFFFVLSFLTNVLFLQVNIQVPAHELQSDIISITGLASHLDRAKEGLLERVKELQAEQEDRVSLIF